MAATKTQLVFALNGEKVELPAKEVDPTISLNEYLRRSARLTGTKLSCGEGGCGACTVNLSRYDANLKKEVSRSVNSCLYPLASLDGWSVTTTEGLGNKDSMHPVQDRLANFNGAQCGFCTPGMVMQLFSGLKANPNPTMRELEDRFDGNICRCTGYRPILDAAKSFAVDSNVVDHVCKTVTVAPYDSSANPAFPDFLKEHDPVFLNYAGSGKTWLRPTAISDLYTMLSAPGPRPRVVNGSTSNGIYKNQPGSIVLDVSAVADLHGVTVTPGGIKFGASTTLTQFSDALKDALASQSSDKTASFEALIAHVNRIASHNIRNVGTVVGNLCMAKSLGFYSDLATILLGAEATVNIGSLSDVRTSSLEEFFSTPTFEKGEIVTSLLLPSTAANTAFSTYKSAIRPVNSHAMVNAAFNCVVVDGTIKSATIAYGAVGEANVPGCVPVLAKGTMAALEGKPANAATLADAIAVLSKEVVPVGGREEYRKRLVAAFLFKFFASIASPDARVASVSASVLTDRPVVSSKQEFDFPEEHAPVSKAIPELSANLKACGEAAYTDDMEPHEGTLFGAFVHSTEHCATVDAIDVSACLAMDGVNRVIGASDVPGSNDAFGNPLFVDVGGEIVFKGQRIVMVLANSKRRALEAAKLAKISYTTKDSVITVDAAVAVAPTMENSHKSSDDVDIDAEISKGPHSVSGTVRMGGQKHFYMEPQVSYAVPDENGMMAVYCATQWPDSIHTAVAGALGVQANKVRVVCRRAGGGFGGKLDNATPIAAVSAVAAAVSGRPVRLALERHEDALTCGGREDTLSEYAASFDDNGKILALKMDGHLVGGHKNGFTNFASMSYAAALTQCYHVPVFNIASKVHVSNRPPRTALRGPGETNASYTMETLIEHIAYTLKKSPTEIREANFFPTGEESAPNGTPVAPFTLPLMWDSLKEKADVDTRAADVEAFNKANRWKKRGISMTPVRYQVNVFGKSALVNVYGDGTVLVTTSGSEMGQGLQTKISQAVANALGAALVDEDSEETGPPLDMGMIRVGDCDSNITPNALFTGGSTGSEGSAMAATRACAVLVGRLRAVRQAAEAAAAKEREAKEAAGEEVAEVIRLDWKGLVGAALAGGASLMAEGHWSATGEDSLSYMNYGCAVSVVEIDVLTGEMEMISTNMSYDAGKSLNPAIDIGQAEGAFIMGVGYFLQEEEVVAEDGTDLSTGTWEYKPPCYRNIPAEFTVELLNSVPFERGFLSSKCSGEPPLVLATSIATALRMAITEARRDAGAEDFIQLPVPLTVEAVSNACAATPEQFGL